MLEIFNRPVALSSVASGRPVAIVSIRGNEDKCCSRIDDTRSAGKDGIAGTISDRLVNAPVEAGRASGRDARIRDTARVLTRVGATERELTIRR